jgi:hypothetical protein
LLATLPYAAFLASTWKPWISLPFVHRRKRVVKIAVLMTALLFPPLSLDSVCMGTEWSLVCNQMAGRCTFFLVTFCIFYLYGCTAHINVLAV